MEGSLLTLDVPIRSQFDNSEYQTSNCGPTALAMVLDAFGVSAPTAKLRNLANVLQGTFGPEDGIALDYLAQIAHEAGLRLVGLREGDGYRRWSVDDVRDQVRQGHPVITLVKLWELPDHAGAESPTDHYVVVVGLDGDRLLINDPALPGETGFRRLLTDEQLERAWAASSIPRQALAIAAPSGVPELRFQGHTAGDTPGIPRELLASHIAAVPPAPVPTATVPVVPTAPPMPVGGAPDLMPEPAAAGSSDSPGMTADTPPPTPIPTHERWLRPEGWAPSGSAARSGVTAAGDAGTTLVLSEVGAAPVASSLHWIVRLTLLAFGLVGARWALR